MQATPFMTSEAISSMELHLFVSSHDSHESYSLGRVGSLNSDFIICIGLAFNCTFYYCITGPSCLLPSLVKHALLTGVYSPCGTIK